MDARQTLGARRRRNRGGEQCRTTRGCGVLVSRTETGSPRAERRRSESKHWLLPQWMTAILNDLAQELVSVDVVVEGMSRRGVLKRRDVEALQQSAPLSSFDHVQTMISNTRCHQARRKFIRWRFEAEAIDEMRYADSACARIADQANGRERGREERCKESDLRRTIRSTSSSTCRPSSPARSGLP